MRLSARRRRTVRGALGHSGPSFVAPASVRAKRGQHGTIAFSVLDLSLVECRRARRVQRARGRRARHGRAGRELLQRARDPRTIAVRHRPGSALELLARERARPDRRHGEHDGPDLLGSLPPDARHVERQGPRRHERAALRRPRDEREALARRVRGAVLPTAGGRPRKDEPVHDGKQGFHGRRGPRQSLRPRPHDGQQLRPIPHRVRQAFGSDTGTGPHAPHPRRSAPESEPVGGARGVPSRGRVLG